MTHQILIVPVVVMPLVHVDPAEAEEPLWAVVLDEVVGLAVAVELVVQLEL